MPKSPVDFKDGVVYLIHFDRPFGHAQHYIGLASDFEKRMERHKQGRGSNLIRVIQNAGIGWHVVRIWEAGVNAPAVEKELKAYHNSRHLCPECCGKFALDKAERLRATRAKKRLEENARLRENS